MTVCASFSTSYLKITCIININIIQLKFWKTETKGDVDFSLRQTYSSLLFNFVTQHLLHYLRVGRGWAVLSGGDRLQCWEQRWGRRAWKWTCWWCPEEPGAPRSAVRLRGKSQRLMLRCSHLLHLLPANAWADSWSQIQKRNKYITKNKSQIK